MSLKDLTKENHANAERQEFVKILFNDIPDELYAQYLYNQFPMYELLELLANRHGLFMDLAELPRRTAILNDFNELWPDINTRPETCPVVKQYLDHLMTIQDDPHKLMAHVYVRHMGDLSGGQMIAKRVPGSCRFYQFDNPELLKEKIRSKVDDTMADEAKLCFDYASQLFKEMMDFVKK